MSSAHRHRPVLIETHASLPCSARRDCHPGQPMVSVIRLRFSRTLDGPGAHFGPPGLVSVRIWWDDSLQVLPPDLSKVPWNRQRPGAARTSSDFHHSLHSPLVFTVLMVEWMSGLQVLGTP